MARDDDWTSHWLDEEALAGATPATSSPRRRRFMLVAAALPWLVVVVVLVLPGRFGASDEASPPRGEPDAMTGPPSSPGTTARGEPTTPAEGRSEAAERPEHQPPPVGDGSAPAAGEPAPGSEPDVAELRGAWRVEPGEGAAAVIATAVARAWLTGMEPPLPVAGLETPASASYAEHLAVEAVERVAADAAVVTILAVVLEGDDELEARLRRLAVPIAWADDGPQPAGAPWPLPTPELTVHELAAGEVVSDPEVQAAAATALEDAGFADVEVHELEKSPTAPVTVARIAARTAAGEPVETSVWLRHHLDGFVVAGTTLHDVHEAAPRDTAPEDDG